MKLYRHNFLYFLRLYYIYEKKDLQTYDWLFDREFLKSLSDCRNFLFDSQSLTLYRMNVNKPNYTHAQFTKEYVKSRFRISI